MMFMIAKYNPSCALIQFLSHMTDSNHQSVMLILRCELYQLWVSWTLYQFLLELSGTLLIPVSIGTIDNTIPVSIETIVYNILVSIPDQCFFLKIWALNVVLVLVLVLFQSSGEDVGARVLTSAATLPDLVRLSDYLLLSVTPGGAPIVQSPRAEGSIEDVHSPRRKHLLSCRFRGFLNLNQRGFHDGSQEHPQTPRRSRPRPSKHPITNPHIRLRLTMFW